MGKKLTEGILSIENVLQKQRPFGEREKYKLLERETLNLKNKSHPKRAGRGGGLFLENKKNVES